MHIEVVLGRGRFCRWHTWAVEDLRALPKLTVTVRYTEHADPVPAALRTLLSFERLIGLARAEGGAYPLPDPAIKPNQPINTAADLIIDLSGRANPRPGTARTLTPLFDGSSSEHMLWSALLDGRAPALSLSDNRGCEIAIGLPAIEAPHHISDSASAVYSRLVESLVQTAANIAAGRSAPVPARASQHHCAPAARKGSVTSFAAACVHSKATALLDIMLRGPQRWCVAWRKSAARRSPQSAILNTADFRVLKDDGQRFYADPFVIFHEGLHHVFVEELSYATGRGLISHFTVDRSGNASSPRPVLESSQHLSYPHVFAMDGEIWMLPESAARGFLEIFRAERFPDRWVPAGRLIEAQVHDATLVHDSDQLWMFATRPYRDSSTWDGLAIYRADTLLGPWTPHPMNPALLDARAARPAGAMFTSNGAIWRPVQDCSAGYGSALGLARITSLDGQGFAQDTCARLSFPAAEGILGPHTLNWDAGLEVIDMFARP